jgi:hypothetical protein
LELVVDLSDELQGGAGLGLDGVQRTPCGVRLALDLVELGDRRAVVEH